MREGPHTHHNIFFFLDIGRWWIPFSYVREMRNRRRMRRKERGTVWNSGDDPA